MLRSGEVEVTTAGGKCSVCKNRIEPGKAVQLSRWTSRIRHITCMPKTDTRQGVKPLSKNGPIQVLPQ